MNRIFLLITMLLCACISGRAQDNTALFSRLHGIHTPKGTLYAVDHLSIVSHTYRVAFTTKGISNIIKSSKVSYRLKQSELTGGDAQLSYPNYHVQKTVTEGGTTYYVVYYFVQKAEMATMAVSFASYKPIDPAFARNFVQLVYDDAIPENIYSDDTAHIVNFAGRQIEVPKAYCGWRDINNLQCSHNGQMNWQVHNSLSAATEALQMQYDMIDGLKQGRITADSAVTVVFEGAEVQARKIIFDFVAARSALIATTGGKYLNVYLVVAPVRGNYVSCVLSFWNNDNIVEGKGLPPLLLEVMTLKQ